MQGIQACATQTALKPVTTTVTPVCPTCATNKKGTATCCTKGGSWYQNCGDAGDANFDYTWTQGFEACENVVGAGEEAQAQAKLPHQTTIVQHQNAFQPSDMDSTGALTSKYNDITHIMVFTGLLHTIRYL